MPADGKGPKEGARTEAGTGVRSRAGTGVGTEAGTEVGTGAGTGVEAEGGAGPAAGCGPCCGALSRSSPEQTVAALAGAAELAGALAVPARLDLLCHLWHGERSTTELAEATGLGRPNAAKHLRELHRLGLVRRRREGGRLLYRAGDPRIFRLIEQVWRDLASEAA